MPSSVLVSASHFILGACREAGLVCNGRRSLARTLLHIAVFLSFAACSERRLETLAHSPPPTRTAEQQPSPGQASLPDDWTASAESRVREQEYQPTLQTSDRRGLKFDTPKWHFTNRSHNLRSYIDERGWQMEPRNTTDPEGRWTWRYSFQSAGRAETGPPDELPSESAPRKRSVRIEQENNRVLIENSQQITEWYTNSPAGIEQGFQIHERPSP